jgi:hypothetical protein
MFGFICLLVLFSVVSSETCLAEGFGANVACGTCEHFNTIGGKNGGKSMVSVYEKCKECCTEDDIIDGESVKKYNLVVLEVDKRFVDFYPEFLVKFIAKIKKQKKKSNSNLLIRYQFGSRPTLLCYENKDDELPMDNLSIQSWDDDTLQDFLKTHLVDNEKEKKEKKK